MLDVRLPNILYRWLPLSIIILPKLLLHALQYLSFREATRFELPSERLLYN